MVRAYSILQVDSRIYQKLSNDAPSLYKLYQLDREIEYTRESHRGAIIAQEAPGKCAWYELHAGILK